MKEVLLMKRANGEGTISKLADGRWIGQITLDFDDWDNIDFKTGRIYVTNSVCELKGKIIIKTTKTDTSKRSYYIQRCIFLKTGNVKRQD